MAAYPKIWTTIRHEPWFKRLPAVQRNIWLESILIAKEQTDNGWLSFCNRTHFAQETGSDRTSIDRWIDRESSQDRIKIEEKSKKLLRFQICNYNSSQDVRHFRDMKISAGNEINGNKYKKEINNSIPATPDSDEQANKDPTRHYILDAIRAEIKSKLNVDCSYQLAGQIVKLAGWQAGEPYPWGLYGHIMVCISRVSKWVTKKQFMGAITGDLRKRHTEWPDSDRELIKAYEGKFETWMKQEFPEKITFKIGGE